MRSLVGEGGLEPPRPFGHRNLNPARLPNSATRPSGAESLPARSSRALRGVDGAGRVGTGDLEDVGDVLVGAVVGEDRGLERVRLLAPARRRAGARPRRWRPPRPRRRRRRRRHRRPGTSPRSRAGTAWGRRRRSPTCPGPGCGPSPPCRWRRRPARADQGSWWTPPGRCAGGRRGRHPRRRGWSASPRRGRRPPRRCPTRRRPRSRARRAARRWPDRPAGSVVDRPTSTPDPGRRGRRWVRSRTASHGERGTVAPMFSPWLCEGSSADSRTWSRGPSRGCSAAGSAPSRSAAA